MTTRSPTTGSPHPRACPICRRPAAPDQAPFCSRRCREVDLGRWFGEDYRVPAAAPSPEDSE